MARTEARIKCAIWKDDDYRSLSVGAQWLYEAILSQSDLSQCGVITWAPKRFAGLAKDASAATIKKFREELRTRRYVVVDDDTDELWVRTFAKNDGILDSPNLIIAMSHDFGAIHSTTIREGLVEGLGEGFLEGLPERFKKPLPDGYRERLAKPFVEALGRPRGGGSAPQRSRVPQAPSPTPQTPADEHRSSSALELGATGVEEEDHSRESWDGLVAARLIAKRRCEKLTDPPPEGFRRNAWLKTTLENLIAGDGDLIREHLAAGLAVEAVVDLFEPPAVESAAPPSPYPAAGQQPAPTYDEVLVDGEWKLVEHGVSA